MDSDRFKGREYPTMLLDTGEEANSEVFEMCCCITINKCCASLGFLGSLAKNGMRPLNIFFAIEVTSSTSSPLLKICCRQWDTPL